MTIQMHISLTSFYDRRTHGGLLSGNVLYFSFGYRSERYPIIVLRLSSRV